MPIVHLALAVVSIWGAAAKPCAPPGKETSVFLEYEVNAARDAFGVRICLAAPGSARAGSFHLEVLYDSTALRASAVRPAASAGAQASNPNKAGVVGIAGANPGGIGAGEIATISFRRVKKGSRKSFAPFVVRLLEINGTTGSTMLTGARTYGLSSAGVRVAGATRSAAVTSAGGTRAADGATTDRAPASGSPHLDSITPARARVMRGGVITIDVYGSRFAPVENQVLLSGTAIAAVPSPNQKTLRFILPNTFASNSEAPPRQVMAGEYEIQIRTAAGVSNSVRLILENP